MPKTSTRSRLTLFSPLPSSSLRVISSEIAVASSPARVAPSRIALHPARPPQPVSQPLSKLLKSFDSFEHFTWLPNSAHAFVLYVAGLTLIFAGLFIHVFLSAQILEAQVKLTQLKSEQALLERQNGELIWQIARETNLGRLQQRIVAQGYVPVTDRQYVTISADHKTPQPAVHITTTAAQDQAKTQIDGVQPAHAVVTRLAPQPSAAAKNWDQWRSLLQLGKRANTPIWLRASATTATSAATTEKQSTTDAWWQGWWQQTKTSGTTLLQSIIGRHP